MKEVGFARSAAVLAVSAWLLAAAVPARASFPPAPPSPDKTVTIPEKTFDLVLKTFEDLFQPLAASRGEKLVVMGSWDEEWASSFARRWPPEAQVIVYGGFARRAEMNADSLAMVLCHELGHLYGGEPLSDAHNRVSAEGQADYWGAKECLPKLQAALQPDPLPQLPPYVKDRCGSDAACSRALLSILRLGAFLAKNNGVPAPEFETPDATVAQQTLLTHPDVQCRLDTYLAGFNGGPRPRCWFAGPAAQGLAAARRRLGLGLGGWDGKAGRDDVPPGL